MLETIRSLIQPASAPQHGNKASGRLSIHRAGAIIRTALLFIVFSVSVSAVVGPVQPSEQQYLVAAAGARTNYRYDLALDWYRRASRAMPQDARPWCLSGDVRMLQQLWAQAVNAYQRCVALEPASGSASLALGDAYSASGQSAQAESAWNVAAAHGSVPALERLALLDEQHQQFAGAVREWSLMPPDNPEAQVHLGLLALLRGDFATARANFIAARATPNRFANQVVDSGLVSYAAHPLAGPEGLVRLGYLLLTAGLPAFSLPVLQAATGLVPTNGIAWAYLGWTWWLLNDGAQATVTIERAAHLTPSDSFVCYVAGELALRNGQWADAQDWFQRGLQTNAKNVPLWEGSAQALLAQHQYFAADIAYDNAARLSTDASYTVVQLQFYLDHHFGLSDGRARTAAMLALQRFSASEPVRYLVAALYALYNYPTLAYYTAVAAQQMNPADPAPYVLLGRFAEDTGDYVAAALDLRTALALQPEGPYARQAAALLVPLAQIAV